MATNSGDRLSVILRSQHRSCLRARHRSSTEALEEQLWASALEESAEHNTGWPAVWALMCQCYLDHWAMLWGKAQGHWCFPEHWAAPWTFMYVWWQPPLPQAGLCRHSLLWWTHLPAFQHRGWNWSGIVRPKQFFGFPSTSSNTSGASKLDGSLYKTHACTAQSKSDPLCQEASKASSEWNSSSCWTKQSWRSPTKPKILSNDPTRTCSEETSMVVVIRGLLLAALFVASKVFPNQIVLYLNN